MAAKKPVREYKKLAFDMFRDSVAIYGQNAAAVAEDLRFRAMLLERDATHGAIVGLTTARRIVVLQACRLAVAWADFYQFTKTRGDSPKI